MNNGGATIDRRLSEAEIAEILEDASHYTQKSGASIEALKIVQKHRGWVSDESLKQIADLLDMSVDELDGVATFYNLIYRRPVGRNVILCCDSVSCWMLGADRVREKISERLGIGYGETTPDGEYTLLPIVCLGACDHAPVVMVGEDLYHDVDEARLDQMLNKGA
ncbi:MAG: NADH-quinone oxidoreductase subunit NuoE [Methylococcaceae bacterium]|nr:NADH-quinone oxidoreductase subunit NuoE [Methylococcaceae bacterium]MCI0666885.1 NADH-quinone oxidoreductase subunit NuoE [Methylococcaceae bacterium]MCI0733816.1 NADH-quinone oxidoreductase subunit NuoE [Methylococcaceae bacterium]